MIRAAILAETGSVFLCRLINQTLGEPFIPFSDVLLCDRAIAMPIPTDDRRLGIEPYTTSTALSAAASSDMSAEALDVCRGAMDRA